MSTQEKKTWPQAGWGPERPGQGASAQVQSAEKAVLQAGGTVVSPCEAMRLEGGHHAVYPHNSPQTFLGAEAWGFRGTGAPRVHGRDAGPQPKGTLTL